MVVNQGAYRYKIRGNTSIGASSSPLIVVDGFVGADYATG
jgi:hypothetical protein